MNGKKAKMLRRLAVQEMGPDDGKEWVASPQSESTAVNSPETARAMHLRLKKAWLSRPHKRV